MAIYGTFTDEELIAIRDAGALGASGINVYIPGSATPDQIRYFLSTYNGDFLINTNTLSTWYPMIGSMTGLDGNLNLHDIDNEESVAFSNSLTRVGGVVNVALTDFRDYDTSTEGVVFDVNVFNNLTSDTPQRIEFTGSLDPDSEFKFAFSGFNSLRDISFETSRSLFSAYTGQDGTLELTGLSSCETLYLPTSFGRDRITLGDFSGLNSIRTITTGIMLNGVNLSNIGIPSTLRSLTYSSSRTSIQYLLSENNFEELANLTRLGGFGFSLYGVTDLSFFHQTSRFTSPTIVTSPSSSIGLDDFGCVWNTSSTISNALADSSPFYYSLFQATYPNGRTDCETPIATPDVTPDPFNFNSSTGQELNTLVESDAVTLSGFEGSLPVTLVGGLSTQARKNGGEWSTSLSVSDGDTLQIRSTTPNAHDASNSVFVRVGLTFSNWLLSTSENNTPVVANPLEDISIDVDQILNVDVSNVFTDADGHELSYSLVGAPSSLSIVDNSIVGKVDLNDIGTYPVALEAGDGIGGIGVDFFILEVKPEKPKVADPKLETSEEILLKYDEIRLAEEAGTLNVGAQNAELIGLYATLKSES